LQVCGWIPARLCNCPPGSATALPPCRTTCPTVCDPRRVPARCTALVIAQRPCEFWNQFHTHLGLPSAVERYTTAMGSSRKRSKSCGTRTARSAPYIDTEASSDPRSPGSVRGAVLPGSKAIGGSPRRKGGGLGACSEARTCCQAHGVLHQTTGSETASRWPAHRGGDLYIDVAGERLTQRLPKLPGMIYDKRQLVLNTDSLGRRPPRRCRRPAPRPARARLPAGSVSFLHYATCEWK